MPSRLAALLRRGSKSPSEVSASAPTSPTSSSSPPPDRLLDKPSLITQKLAASSDYLPSPPTVEPLPPSIIDERAFPTGATIQQSDAHSSYTSPPPVLTVEAPSPPVRPKVTVSVPHSSLQNKPPTPDSRPISPNTSIPEETQHTQNFKHTEQDNPAPPHAPPSPPTTNPYTVQIEDYFGQASSMAIRKLWIKRPNASATSVKVSSEDLVDDVRDMVLRKYGNSLGRSFDAPDVTLRIIPREKSQHALERTLDPEEPVFRLLDAYFPGGQNVDEALIIEMPRKRTPLPSPGLKYPQQQAYLDDYRSQPLETGTDYFPPMPPPGQSSVEPHSLASSGQPHSIGIITTGQLPVIPSPRGERFRYARPKYGRAYTSSPTNNSLPSQSGNNAQGRRQRTDGETSITSPPPSAPPIPTPPPGTEAPSKPISSKATTPPTDSIQSPRTGRNKKGRLSLPPDRIPAPLDEKGLGSTNLFNSKLPSVVPPINVLIVEDNPINLKFMETFAKSLKVRWASAVNGKEALDKWRKGGFHLIFMDLQMPIMSGLEATKEIRRLERVNSIGVFGRNVNRDGACTPTPADRKDSSTTNGGFDDTKPSDIGAATGEDMLPKNVFLSPVIIVALTASSLESDRHEALAAGCNDFLTKPVRLPWLERKVTEWGCMQALVDFEGWRQWKQMADEKAAEEQRERERKEAGDPEAKAKREKKEASRRALMEKMGRA